VKRLPTMKDVAQLAGVGTMTVSRFLNGSASVSKEASERVEKAIRTLHYRPNQMARALRGQRSRSIGLIIPYIYDPFFAAFGHCVTEVAKQRGYTVLITTSDEDPETEYNEASQMLQRYVEGLIVIPANHGVTRLNKALMGRVPLVAFDRPIDEPAFDTVLVQNQSGARRLTEHLIGHGHRRIVFMGLRRDLYTIDARFQGYRRAMSEAGLPAEPCFNCASMESTRQVIENHLCSSQPPTAYLTSNTLASRFVLTELLRRNIKVPGEIALAAFDDFYLADILSPPLTVARQPVEELGRAAAKQLFARLDNRNSTQTGVRTVLPVDLVLRQSCGCTHQGERVVS
jgi:LacI family transcriptional regulator